MLFVTRRECLSAMMAALAALAALVLYPDAVTALDNGLALTPPMGWVSLQRHPRDGDLGRGGGV